MKMVQELFYPRYLAIKRFTFWLATNHWHKDKTMQSTNFYSLKNLIFHSYWARIITIIKKYFEKLESILKLHNNKVLGMWFLEIILVQ